MSVASVVVVVLCVVCMAVSGLVCTLANWQMVDDLNRERPPEAKYTTIGLAANYELNEVLSEYWRLYPGGALFRRAIWSYVCGFLALTVSPGVLGGASDAALCAFGGALLGGLTWWASSPRTS